MVNILEVFFLPPMAVARLGGSQIPLENFTWAEDPTVHGGARTVIVPQVTLELQDDGSLRPYLPSSIRFRDGTNLRPAAPFFELHAMIEQLDGTATSVPLTHQLLDAAGGSLGGVMYRVSLANRKAARRTNDDACAFQASATVRASDFNPQPLLASSPTLPRSRPLVAFERPIPLGCIQAIKPLPLLEMGINLDVLRVRFTPARGEVYGPPTAVAGLDSETDVIHQIVRPENRILNPDSAWTDYDADFTKFDSPAPFDTYDGADEGNNQSYGVVDDTCDGSLDALVVVGPRRFRARARIFVGPPDYAPDRRHFVSLADDLADRELPLKPDDDLELTVQEVADLFQRVYETATLTNLDSNRLRGLAEDEGQGGSTHVAGTPLTDQGSMTAADTPYVDQIPQLLVPPTPEEPLPYSAVARDVHSSWADIDILMGMLRLKADHVRQLLRPPYAVLRELQEQPPATPDPRQRDPRVARDRLHDMRMPPFIRDSDGTPVSVTRRQYRQIMALLDILQPVAAVQPQLVVPGAAPAPPVPEVRPLRAAVARVATRRRTARGADDTRS